MEIVKPKLSLDGQIEHLKEKGVLFNIMDEAEARDYLGQQAGILGSSSAEMKASERKRNRRELKKSEQAFDFSCAFLYPMIYYVHERKSHSLPHIRVQH